MVAIDDGSAHVGARQARPPPHVQHSTGQRVVKGEDVIDVRPLSIKCEPQAMLYLVCDGHSGVSAAKFVATNFSKLLEPKLPPAMPDIGNVKEMELFAEQLRKAMCETFVRLDIEWSRVCADFSGTTVTAVITTGWLVTICNIGDSSAICDTGTSILELSKSHRIHTNLEEQARLKSAGCTVAPLGFHLQGPAKVGEPGVGPLRIWPGGLCVSRSIGDHDAGKEVVPVPHIRQLLMPSAGCRLIISSDGLWDTVDAAAVSKLTCVLDCHHASAALMTAVRGDRRVLDDVSVIVLDVLPSAEASFPMIALKAGRRNASLKRVALMVRREQKRKERKGGSGLFSCFSSAAAVEQTKPSVDDQPVPEPLYLLFSDLGCLEVYPGLMNLLARKASPTPACGRPSNTANIRYPPLQTTPPGTRKHVPQHRMPARRSSSATDDRTLSPTSSWTATGPTRRPASMEDTFANAGSSACPSRPASTEEDSSVHARSSSCLVLPGPANNSVSRSSLQQSFGVRRPSVFDDSCGFISIQGAIELKSGNAAGPQDLDTGGPRR